MPLGAASAIPLARKERIDLPLEVPQVRFALCPDGIMDMVRHLAQAQHLDSMLAGKDAVQCEIYQMVTVRIKQHAVIGAPLVTMGQNILEKLPTLHISQQKAEWAFADEFRKDSSKKQNVGRRMEMPGFQEIVQT